MERCRTTVTIAVARSNDNAATGGSVGSAADQAHGATAASSTHATLHKYIITGLDRQVASSRIRATGSTSAQ